MIHKHAHESAQTRPLDVGYEYTHGIHSLYLIMCDFGRR